MNNIKAIQKLTEEELNLGITGKASWHSDYASSAYIHIGGLPFGMNEGDVVTVFSQCGEIVDCNLVRDSDTGKSRGFAFVGYADQRSTVLAVDNFNAAQVCGRVIKVDHVSQYKLPKEFVGEEAQTDFKPTGPDGKGWGEFKRLSKETLDDHNALIADSEVLWERKLMQQIQEDNEKKHKRRSHRSKKHEKHTKVDKNTKKEPEKNSKKNKMP